MIKQQQKRIFIIIPIREATWVGLISVADLSRSAADLSGSVVVRMPGFIAVGFLLVNAS